MLQKIVSAGLLALLLFHILSNVIVGAVNWWQAEHDLSERLVVYRSVDSLVEFQIPLDDQTDSKSIAHTTADGFRYKGHYYNVVSLEVKGNTLQIVGIEAQSRSIWQDDLLAFLNHHLTTPADPHQKAGQILKFLLKEYSPGSAVALQLRPNLWYQTASRIPDQCVTFSTRSAPIPSPPPEHRLI